MSLLHEFHQSGIENYEQFNSLHTNREQEVLEHINSLENQTTDVYFNGSQEHRDALKFLLIYSDYLQIHLLGQKQNDGQYNHAMSLLTGRKPRIHVHPKLQEDFSTELNQSGYQPIYFTFGNQEVAKILNELEPLSEINRLVLRPTKGILKLTGKNPLPFNPDTNGGIKRMVVYPVDPTSTLLDWKLSQPFQKDYKKGIQFVNKPINHEIFNQGLSLTLPFLQDIELGDLAIILKDEEALIAPLRNEIKNLSRKVIAGESLTQEMIDDVLNPRIHQLETKFKQIISKRLFNLSTTSLVYTTASLGMLALDAFTLGGFLTFTGVTSFNLFNKEDMYMTQLNEMETNPYYLLWKIQNSQRS